MPRDSNGNYQLPAGNPVVSGEVISTTWANPTMQDIAVELTNSLDRQGRGGMLGPFKFTDGSVGAPAMTFTNEPTTGFYRFAAQDVRVSIGGVDRFRWNASGAQVWDATNGVFAPLVSTSAANIFTEPQRIQKTVSEWSLWKDDTPTVAARFSLNNLVADGIDISRYTPALGWVKKIGVTDTVTINDFYTAFDYPVGYKNAPMFAFNSNTTYSASLNGRVLRFFGGAGVTVTMVAPTYDGEIITIINQGTAPLSITCAGVFRWMTGSTFTDAATRTLAVGGVATVYGLSGAGVNNWTVWGSGLT